MITCSPRTVVLGKIMFPAPQLSLTQVRGRTSWYLRDEGWPEVAFVPPSQDLLCACQPPGVYSLQPLMQGANHGTLFGTPLLLPPCGSCYIPIVHIPKSPQPELTFPPSNLPNQGPKSEMVEYCMLTWAMTGWSKKTFLLHSPLFLPTPTQFWEWWGRRAGQKPTTLPLHRWQQAEGTGQQALAAEKGSSCNSEWSWKLLLLHGIVQAQYELSPNVFNMSLNFLLLKSLLTKVMDLSKYIFRGRRNPGYICPLSKCEWANKIKLLCDFISHINLVRSTDYYSRALNVYLSYSFFSI